MGTWGTGAFENDTALDWVYDLEDAEGTGFLAEAFDAVLQDEGAEDSDACAVAIAAADVVAAMIGVPSESLPDEVRAWVERQQERPSQALRARAIAALRRIESESELRELWEESGEPQPWYEVLEALRKRLDAADLTHA